MQKDFLDNPRRWRRWKQIVLKYLQSHKRKRVLVVFNNLHSWFVPIVCSFVLHNCVKLADVSVDDPFTLFWKWNCNIDIDFTDLVQQQNKLLIILANKSVFHVASGSADLIIFFALTCPSKKTLASSIFWIFIFCWELCQVYFIKIGIQRRNRAHKTERCRWR